MKPPQQEQRLDPQLRAEAEARLAVAPPVKPAAHPVEELLHDLQVHQIELEMQNETLRQSQVALEESRDRYVDFYDFAPVGYVTLSDKGLVAEINLAGAAMLGIDRARLLQRRFNQSVAAEDGERWRRHFIAALRQDAKLDCEVTLLRLDGSRCEVRIDSQRLLKEGKPPVLRVVLTDINERKRAEDELAASVRFTRSLIESMHDGLSVVDANGVHLDVNPALCRMTGFAREQLLGCGVPQPYWPPEAHAAIHAAFDSLLQGELDTVELTFMRNSGERFPVSVSPSPVKDGTGRVVCYMATVKDITAQKRAEERLAELAASLEEKVSLRTRQLRALAAQLALTEERERRSLAEELHDNLSQLLAVIRIKLASLAAGPLPSQIEQIAALVDQAEQSARMITMELSPPILHTLGFVPALQWLADDMRQRYGLTVHIDDEHGPRPMVQEIQAMLYRSVRELLVNVVKHAGAREASVYCHCDGSQLTLVVSDDGCGFDQARAHEAALAQSSFGLSSIRERVTNIGGNMDIDSSPGIGTTVTLTVPCSVAAKENRP